MERNFSETAASKIVPLGYRARCTAPACRNLGRLILRYADTGGRPTAGLKIYDDRNG